MRTKSETVCKSCPAYNARITEKQSKHHTYRFSPNYGVLWQNKYYSDDPFRPLTICICNCPYALEHLMSENADVNRQ